MSMPTVINPNFLDQQHPNLIDTKKFGDIASSLPMASAGDDSDEDVGIRCRVLTRIYANKVSRKFAADIGISETRWNGIEGSGALSRDVASLITRKYPEVSLDWLYRGLDDWMPRREGEELAEHFRAVAAEFRPVEKKVRKRRSG